MTRFRVRVQPGARARGLAGFMADGTPKLRVIEAPEDGRANRAVAELVAEILGIKKGDVRVVAGAASRGKTIEVAGLEKDAVRARLAAARRVGDNDGE